MGPPITVRARQVVLGIIAAVFTAIAVMSLVIPDTMADGLGYRLDNVDARNEYRAVYVGLWLATAAIYIMGVMRPRDRALALVCVLLVGGQVLGRVISIFIDGAPTPKLYAPAVVELIGTLVLVALFPKRSEGSA